MPAEAVNAHDRPRVYAAGEVGVGSALVGVVTNSGRTTIWAPAATASAIAAADSSRLACGFPTAGAI